MKRAVRTGRVMNKDGGELVRITPADGGAPADALARVIKSLATPPLSGDQVTINDGHHRKGLVGLTGTVVGQDISYPPLFKIRLENGNLINIFGKDLDYGFQAGQ